MVDVPASHVRDFVGCFLDDLELLETHELFVQTNWWRIIFWASGRTSFRECISHPLPSTFFGLGHETFQSKWILQDATPQTLSWKEPVCTLGHCSPWHSWILWSKVFVSFLDTAICLEVSSIRSNHFSIANYRTSREIATNMVQNIGKQPTSRKALLFRAC